MKDFLGQTLVEGDHVVYHTAGRYGMLRKGKVIHFTPKMVVIQTTKRWGTGDDEIHCCPGNLIKFNPEGIT